MEKIREITTYKSYFSDYYTIQNAKLQAKIDFVLYILETQHFVPDTYVKHITGSNGIYEIRVSTGSNEYRVLFFFENGDLISGGKVVILGNGFLKKANRDYKKAVQLAEAIKEVYFEEKVENDINKDIDNI